MSYTPITEFHLETREFGSSTWRAYSVSPHADGELYHSAGKLYLTKLQLATAYQARVKSHNKEGMNSWSPVFTSLPEGEVRRQFGRSAFVSVILSEPRQEQMTQASAGKIQFFSCFMACFTVYMLRCLS